MKIRTLLIALGVALGPALLASPASAAVHAHEPEAIKWSFAGPTGTFDRAALQRGFQVYKEVCAACHSLRLLSYRNLGEPGGPFEAVKAKDHETGAEGFALGVPGEGKRAVDANDNPYVKAIAAEYEVSEIDPQTGDPVSRKARPSDRFVKPYPNDGAARGANGGALPPDLSMIIRAREGGADYVHALMLGYDHQPPPGVDLIAGKHWNPYFAGGWISMPKQLTQDRVTYSDGTNATPDQMSRDVATFLAWASNPHAEAQKRMGIQVVFYLVLITILLYLSYRQIWKNVH